jgi:hypothetical protein
MPLTEREAFKVGFLARCAEEGLGRGQVLALVKDAADKVAGIIGDVAGIGKDVFSVAAPVALLAPPALGALAGAGLAKATDIDPSDVEDIKDREVIQSYHRESARLRRQRAVRDYARARAASGRTFL